MLHLAFVFHFPTFLSRPSTSTQQKPDKLHTISRTRSLCVHSILSLQPPTLVYVFVAPNDNLLIQHSSSIFFEMVLVDPYADVKKPQRGHPADPVRKFKWSECLWDQNLKSTTGELYDCSLLNNHKIIADWSKKQLADMNTECDGLIENSIKEMSSEIQANIDPELFDRYRVNTRNNIDKIKVKDNTIKSYEKWLKSTS